MNLAKEYLEELVNFGGDIIPRGSAIKKMEKIAPNRKCIELWLIGYERQYPAFSHPFKQQGE